MISQNSETKRARENLSDDLPELQLYSFVTITAELYASVLTVQPWAVTQHIPKRNARENLFDDILHILCQRSNSPAMDCQTSRSKTKRTREFVLDDLPKLQQL